MWHEIHLSCLISEVLINKNIFMTIRFNFIFDFNSSNCWTYFAQKHSVYVQLPFKSQTWYEIKASANLFELQGISIAAIFLSNNHFFMHLTSDECHAWLHLYGLSRPALSAWKVKKKKSKWKILPTSGLELIILKYVVRGSTEWSSLAWENSLYIC